MPKKVADLTEVEYPDWGDWVYHQSADATSDYKSNVWNAFRHGFYASAWVSWPTTVSVPHNTETPIPFDAHDYGQHPWWDSGDPTHLVVPTGMDGPYIVHADAVWLSGGSGQLEIRIIIDDLYQLKNWLGPASSSAHSSAVATTYPVWLSAGQTLKTIAIQTTGATRTIQGAPNYTTLSVHRAA